MKLAPFVAALSLTLSASAFANDGIGGVDLGNIKLGHTDKVAMAKEVLDISPNRVSVDYEFLNETDKDVHESLVFPLPPYHSDDGYEDGYFGQPPGFRILVDGQEKPFSTHVVATIEDKDVTAQLRALGLTDRQIALFPGEGNPFDVKTAPFTPAQMAVLKKKGWMTPDSDNKVSPTWTVSVAYVWYVTFPAGKVLHVHHEYRPFPTVGIGTVQMTSADLKDRACADDAFLADWKKVSKPSGDSRYTSGLFVGYVLETGNTWKDGIRDFTLRLHRPSPAGLISTCFPFKSTAPDPLTSEYHLTNFHPAQDLSIYFGNLPEKLSNPATTRIPPRIGGGE